MKIPRLLCLLALLGTGARASDRLPLQNGESLSYEVSWVMLPLVGRIEIAARADGPGRLRLVSTTASSGLAHLLLPFEARSEESFDTASGRLLSLTETSATRSQVKSHRVTFDYAGGGARYVDSQPPGHVRLLQLPPGYPTDLITCLLEARRWRLRPGGTRDVLVLFNDEFYQLTVHAVGYEDVETPLGRFSTLVLEPRMEKTPPKGMFKRGSSIRVWISQDERRLPVQFEVWFKFGFGVAELTAYHPPAAVP